MTGWPEFATALALFVGTHFLPTRRGLRDRLIEVMGRRVYFSVYGLVSLLVVVWLTVAANRAPYVSIWSQLEWHRWVPTLVMPVAILLAVLGAGVAYPHTLGGRRSGGFDRSAPGAAALSRHPLLWALTLWSLAHLVANGDVAHVILFGGFALLSVGAMAIFDRRARRSMSPEDWAAVQRRTHILSLAPLMSRRWLRECRATLVRSALITFGLFLMIILLHEPLIGVSPLPR
ncbi:NnrU family protein [Palleronia sp.]|uniref:NnrU family protein n=1 Tax=Palleronia sp. TaxID=1940284 RepID=UPI0035C86ABB